VGAQSALSRLSAVHPSSDKIVKTVKNPAKMSSPMSGQSSPKWLVIWPVRTGNTYGSPSTTPAKVAVMPLNLEIPPVHRYH
jgi:hypothetical protein